MLAQLVLNEFFGGIPMQFAVSAAGVAIMIGVAALMEWFVAAQGASGGRALGAPMAGKGARAMTTSLLTLRHCPDRRWWN